MAKHTIACHACGTPFSFDGTLSFREECARCAADLHACLTCRFYDRYVENECRESEAEYVKTKDRRNLCEYWQPNDGAGGEADDDAAVAKQKLAALFGGKPAPSGAPSHDEAKRRLEELFKKK